MSIRSITTSLSKTNVSRTWSVYSTTSSTSSANTNDVMMMMMMMHRFGTSTIPYPQRRMMTMIRTYPRQQQPSRLPLPPIGAHVRWNSNPSSTIPTGRPPAPRVFPSTGASSTSSSSSSSSTANAAAASSASSSLYARTNNRGPVSWTSLFLITIAAASAVTYYQIERERRLERAMGKIVSSEYNGTAMTTTTSTDAVDPNGNNNNNQNGMSRSTSFVSTNAAISQEDGWTPRPGYLAKRKFIATPSGWFPVDDGFGARESFFSPFFVHNFFQWCCCGDANSSLV